jgi:superfamily I DNA/RNA helicase
MSWRSAGLAVREVWEFEENYRNTVQIAKLALAIARMPHFPDDPDLVEPKAPTADGPLPALVSFGDETGEIRFVTEQAVQRAQTETVAVLFRTREQEETLRQVIRVPATRLHRDLEKWPSGPGLYYGTYHAAKGLEFDAVFLPYLSATRIPHPPDIVAYEAEDAAARDSHLIYVAVTRAKATLVLTYTGDMTTLLPDGADLYTRIRR